MVAILFTLLAGIAPLIGQDLETAAGRPFSLQEALSRGPAVLVFWNSWIPGGQDFVPLLREVERTAKERGWPGAIVVFQDDGDIWQRAIGRDDLGGLPRVVDRRGVLLRQFQVTRAPTVVIVDRAGKVIERSGPSAPQVRAALQRWIELRK